MVQVDGKDMQLLCQNCFTDSGVPASFLLKSEGLKILWDISLSWAT